MFMRSRKRVWIMQAARIKNAWILWKQVQAKEMATMPQHRIGPCPILSTTVQRPNSPINPEDLKIYR
jgi:hypothetical protein